MSAPFPDVETQSQRGGVSADPFAQAFQPREVTVLRDERGTPFAHIPTFYTPHEHPENIVVTSGGLPLRPPSIPQRVTDWEPFTVAQVAPELRWAIDANGEVLRQDLFAEKMKLVYNEWFTKVHGMKFAGKEDREHIPNVERYVARTVDPRNATRRIDIGYDPDKTSGAIASVLHDADGEPVSSEKRMELLVKAFRDKDLRKALRPHEIDEVAEFLGGETSVPVSQDQTAAKLEELTAMLQSGDITQSVYVRRVSALTGTVPIAGGDHDEEPVKPKPQRRKPSKMTLTCGAEVWPFHKTRHIAKCDVCKGLGGDEAA